MERRKRKIGMVLPLIMTVGMLVAGCSSKSDTPSNTSTSTTKAQTEVTQKDGELKPVKLVWYLRSAEPKNMPSIMEKANEIIKDKINATVEFKFINPGDYEQKMQLVMSSGEEYDISFTASWTNNYFDNVSKGAYAPLDEMLAKYPDLQNMFKKEVWDAVKVDGKTYGIPNNQIMGDQPGLWMKKDLVDKYNIDVTKVKSLNDLTPIFQTIKDGEPGVSAIRAGIPTSFMEYAPILEGTAGFGYALDTKTWKVYFQPEQLTSQFKLMREWYEKGFFPQDVATIKDELSLIKAGKVFSRYSRQKPGIDAELKTSYGFDVNNSSTGPAVISKSAVTSTLNAVSATSKNPDRAMMLINLIDTNKELFNLLKFGIEGQDHTKVSDNRIETKADAYTVPGWLFGNELNSFVVPGQPDDVWEQTKKLNDSAVIDPSISFTFDRKNVENEIAQLNAITAEYKDILTNGLDDVDKTMKSMMDKRKAAGHDKVLAEIQKQVDEWRKSQ
ncbi:ABC transporter substrate-binding protein [Paenibacillus macquariensis]|uniref:Carbohydrate ABC transporter substrate-binding protein, CUT1 family n=1 Tax=Paenibacillus macquariensis TaxID=948756 RepID=A0ABY1JKU5_9BACL|nr:ABC transporter substrate-binding protein [Paenibacillus macquariensis]MEC0090015.1 ABC transporter substrate-binding protein [Paenibacillus macquariensis]OAB31101.1 hypothetical protein PMSM_20470 [Paenibacillus macquariensis subsp. macquariensis]SIQ36133.1 carbohydrate ABC transporter substrate-binding protein, CUT1 family [Paenibacillus macquariensis]